MSQGFFVFAFNVFNIPRSASYNLYGTTTSAYQPKPTRTHENIVHFM